MSGISYDEADNLIEEFYGPALADGDPDWWADMIEILMEYGTVRDAREWLEVGRLNPEWQATKHDRDGQT